MIRLSTVLPGLLLAVAACAGTAPVRRVTPPPAPPPAEEEPTPEPHVAVLRLEDALVRAGRGNPDLAAAAAAVHAADGRARQAGLLPNPEIEVEAEGFGGPRELAGFGGAESALVLAQSLPVGGRIGARRRVEAYVRDAEAWSLEETRRAVRAETTRAFAAVLAARERLAVAETSVELAEEVVRAVSEQVDAGKIAPLEANRARVELALLRLRRDRLARALEGRRRELAAAWGSAECDFERIEGDLGEFRPVPGEADLLRAIEASPELRRHGSVVARHEAAVDLARAEAIPDLVVRVGVQRFEETGEHAWLAGVGIDLPLLDRNQGERAAARAELRRARHERRAAEVRLRTELASAHRSLALATDLARALRDEILPAARTAYESARAGLRQGKGGLLEVLDAQRTLVEARGDWIDALEEHHRAAAELERLAGAAPDATDDGPRKEARDAR